jgi:hypothetical protein
VRFPTLDEVIACNEAVRAPDEASPGADDDDLDRVAEALEQAAYEHDPIDAAAALASKIAYAQGFYEGNKRTAVLIARWFIATNTDVDPDQLVRPDDHELGDLMIAAARSVFCWAPATAANTELPAAEAATTPPVAARNRRRVMSVVTAGLLGSLFQRPVQREFRCNMRRPRAPCALRGMRARR